MAPVSACTGQEGRRLSFFSSFYTELQLPMFNHLQAYAGDPIFKVAQAFQEDPRQEKINLSIGLYFDDEGQVPVLDVVHAVERSWAERNEPRIYLPMAGLADCCSSVQALLFGQEAVDEGRIATRSEEHTPELQSRGH